MKTCTFSSTGIRNLTAGLVLFCVAILPMAVSAQLTGTKTVGTGGDYATLELAIADLNLVGVGPGGVTFNVAAGHTETITATMSLTATGTLANPIVFQKSGTGANPLVTAYAGTKTPASADFVDGIWRLVGSDYVTINGIDLFDPNTTNPETMEFGFGFFKASGTDGCQNNTIQNCTVTLKNINDVSGGTGLHNGSIGIVIYNVLHTAPGNVTVTSASGSNSHNKIYGNTIQGAFNGIALIGFAGASPFTLCDVNNDIGGSSPATGNIIRNYGNAALINPVTGIFVKDQWSFNISYNTINNNDGGGVNATNTLRGIFTNISSVSASGNINYNTITLKFSGTTTQVSAIEQSAGSTSANNTININYNTIANCTNASATSSTWYGIYNVASCTNLNIIGNNFINNSTNATSGVSRLIMNSGAVAGNTVIKHNNLSHTWPGASANTGTQYFIYNTGGTTSTNFTCDSNTFADFTYNIIATGATYFIHNTSSQANVSFSGNTWNNLSLKHSGNLALIYNASSTQVALNVNNNSIVNGLVRTAAAGAFYLYYSGSSSLGTSTQSFQNNNFSNISGTTTGSGIFYGIYSSDGSASPYPRKTIANNIISDINYPTTGTAYGIYMSYLGDGTSTTGSAIYNNTIANITTTSATLYGLYPTGTASPTRRCNVYNNQIYNIKSNGTTSVVYGCYVGASAGGTNYYNNKIYNIRSSSTGTTGAAHGLYLFSANPYDVYNNYISEIYNPSGTNTTLAASGIYINTGTAVNVSYNTIFLDNTSTSTASFTAGIYSATTPTLALRNNIIVNNSTPSGTGIAAAFRWASTTYTNISALSNNNAYYCMGGANSFLFYDGTNNETTIAGLKTRLAPRESLSVYELPPFVNTATSPYDLHLQATVPTQCESGGITIAGITTDFDGDPRNSVTPDIGADEGGFILLDLLGPSINYPLMPPSGYLISTLVATITDPSGVPTTGTGLPVAYWSIGLLGAQNATQGVSLGNNQYSFAIGAGSVPGDTIYYYVVAQDNAATPNLSAVPGLGAGGFTINPPFAGTPPTNMNYFVRIPAMSGIYTIDNTLPTAGTNFNNFTDAATALNAAGLTGPVVFNVIAGQSWNLTCAASPDNYGIKITNKTATATNTVIFQKFGAGANPILNITGTSATTDAGIWLYEADYITFDGIDVAGAGTTMERGFYLAGSATDGCVGNIIKNCNITLSNTSANINPTGVYVLSTATNAFGRNNYNQFLNNTISNAFYGYRINGVTAFYDMGNVIGIENNGIHLIQNLGYTGGSSTTHGINFSFQDGIEVGNVKIQNIINTTTTSPNNCGIQISGACANINLHHIHLNQMTGGEPYGINFGGACTGINTFNNNLFENITATAGNLNIFRNEGTALGTMSIFSNTFRNMTHNATANSIEGFYLNSATTFNIYNNKLYGWLNNGTGAANINPLNIQNASNITTVFNNMIYDMRAPSSTAAPAVKCIRVNAGTVKLYNNTLLLNYTSLVAGNASAAIQVSAVPTSLEMINNIVVNNCDMTTGTRAVAFWWPSTTYTALTAATNNNIYYAGIPGAKNLIFYNGTTGFQTYADYKAVMIGKDQSSYSENPPFVSTVAPYDLHIQTNVMTLAEGYGQSIAGVTTDIDGDIRFGNPGYLGTSLTGTDIGADEFNGILVPSCAGTPAASTITGAGSVCFNTGTTLALSTTYTDMGISMQWGSSATPGGPYTNLGINPTQATGLVTAPIYFVCTISCSYSGLSYTTPEVVVNTKPNPTAVASSNSPVCPGDPIVFTGTTDIGTTFSWTGPNNFTSALQNPTIPVSTTQSAGVYNFTATENGCSTTGSTIVVIKAAPANVTATASTNETCIGVPINLFSTSQNLQTIIDPNGDGGFENGTDFASNGWTVSNSANNPWVVGSGVTNAAFVNRSAYISNNGGVSNSYTNSAIALNYFYRDITLQAGDTDIKLKFDWVSYGESSWDLMQVFTAPTSVVPVATTTYPGSGTTSVPSGITGATFVGFFQAQTAVQNAIFTLPNSLAGTTFRLIFAWKNDDLYGTDPSGAIDNISLTSIGSSATYSWTSVPPGFTSSDQNPTNVNISVPTTFNVTVLNSTGCSTSASTSVNLVTGAGITTHPGSLEICNGQNATFSIVATGPGLTYQWRKYGIAIDPMINPSASTATLLLNTATISDAGAYDVIVSATCGAPVTSNAAILTVKPVPTALASNNSPICENTTIMLTGTTDIGTEFLWTGPNGYTSSSQNPTIANAALTTAGTYTFKTVLNGCTSLVSNTMVLLNPMPVFTAVTAAPSSLCPGGTSNLSASVLLEQTADKYLFSAGAGAMLDPMTGGTSVILSGNDDTPTPSPAPIGFTFNYEGVDYTNYSVSPDGWVLLGNTTAISQYTNAITSTTNIPKIYPYWDDVATGTDGNVQTLVSGTAPNRIFIVQWFVTIPRNTSGPANSTFQLWLYETSNKIEFRYGTMAAGSMSASVGITGSNSAKYQSITLAAGTSSTTSPNDLNAGQPVPGTMYSFLPPPQVSGYAWTPAASVVSPLLPSTATNPLASTTIFTITATGANNCTNSQNVTVTVNPLPTATTTLNATENICLGETLPLAVDLTGTAPWTLTVNDGTGPMVIPGILTSPWVYPASPTVNTTYTVTQVQDANCTNTSNLSVQVVVDPVPAPVVLTGVVTPLCANSSTTLNAGSGYTTYKWSDNSTAQTLLVDGNVLGGNATANYSVTVTNTFGCEATASTTITTYPTLTVNAGADVSVCPGLSAQLDANGTGGGGTYIQYDWSPAAGLSAINIKNPVATPAVTTTYTVTVTDINNCTASDDVVVTVYPSVVVDFTGLNTGYCVDAPVATLTGSPAGGTFSGPGISGNTFDPAVAGVGGPYTITYTYTDINNCVWTITKPVTVNALPVVSFSGLNAAYCVDAATVTLVGNPSGGTFSGPGIAGTTFSPAAAGVGGPYTITYTYTDGNSCTNSTTGQVTVNGLPVVSFSGLLSNYCVDAGAQAMTGVPPMGIFSGSGVTGNSFDPAIAGAGTHVVTYTYTDGNNCTNSSSQSIVVNALPVLVVTPLATGYCIDNGPVALSGTPSAGVWSGPGVMGSQFIPSMAGAGNHTLMFSYTDANQCYNSTTLSTTVYALPLVSFTTPADICVNAVPVALTGGLPVNGTYSGPGVLAGNFNPSVAGAGSHTLTYTFTDGNNCTNSATASILVNALTPLTFPVLAGVCVDAAPIALNTALPAGGTYSGPGVSSNIFTPAAAGVGIHTITYTHTDGNNCTNSITQTIQVYALPVLTMSPAAVICEGASTNISVTASGAGGYSYLWDNAASLSDPAIANPVATPAATTTYTVAVTDVNLCVQTGSVIVTVNPLPSFIMNPAAVDLCLGGSAQIGVDGNLAGYSFLWDNASTLNNATISWPLANPTVTTTYTVTVTNIATTCQKTGSVVVTVLPNPAPVITGVNPNYCKNAPAVVLTGTPAGGQFFIDNVAVTTLDASTLAVGGHQITYWVTHPNNCQNSATQSFTVRQLPVANAGADQNTCAGLPVLLNASATGGTSPYVYAWTPTTGLSNPNINNPTATTIVDQTYTVMVTDQFGCQGTDDVTVFSTAIPVANAGPDVTICFGQSTQLHATGGNVYSWSPAGSLSDPNIADPIASPAVTTTYTVTASSICGVATDDVVVFVNQLPILSITGLPMDVCVDAAPLTLTGVPAGGTFTGTGIAGNVFNPAVAGVGGPYNITYAYTDGNNCSNTYTQAVTVRPLPVVNFTGLNASYCLNGSAVTLVGTPSGGTFTGPGVTGNVFNPTAAGLGVHTITYTFADGFGCVNFLSKTTTVAQPAVSFTGLNPQYCINDQGTPLVGLPAGGTFTGTGTSGAIFIPYYAGVGTFNVTYTYTDIFGCTNSTTQSTTVQPLTPVSFTGLGAAYCSNNPAVTLTGIPAGGTFSGPGITGNTFNPANAGNGTRTIYYTISGAGFCTNTTSQTTVVNPQPNASFTNLDPKYCISAAPATLTGAPTGGVFTGNGITGNVFSPLAAGAGTHAITYTVTTAANCSNSMTKTTIVNPLPVLSITGLAGPYCANDPVVVLTGTPAGGTFQGPGIVGTNFNPALAGVGTHVISYTYQDANNCVNTITQSVTVNAVPVVTLAPLAPVCEDAGSIALTGGLPAGGVYSGNGVFGNAFYPLLSGTGTHAVTYTYVSSGCAGSATVNQVVNVKPVVNAGSDTTILYNTKANLLGTATGGTGSYTYSWTPAAQVLLPNAYGSLTANLTATTIFTFTAADAFTGCASSDQKIVNVTGSALNVAATTNLPAICVGNSAILTAMPTGGSLNYSTINWTSVPAGSYPHTLSITVAPTVTTIYTVTIFDGYNSATANVTVTVNPLPTVTVNTLPASVCLNAAPVALTGTPAGGAFTGNGVVANTFYPNIAGIGTHTLTYTYTNSNGCTKTATAAIGVNSLPSVNIGYLPASVCINAAPLALTGTPAGGTFSGPGVTGSTFNPATAGLGMNTITYTYADANGCSGTFSKTVNVLPLPVVSIVGLQSNFCVNGASVPLTGSPAGGAFSGPGTGLNTFSPVVAGVGVKTITYTYTNSSGCTNTTSQNVTVNPQPTLAFVGLLTQYCVNASPVTLSATPAGGTFTGTGVTGNTFNPALAGVGTKTITYSYTASTGCSNTITATINVRPISTLSIVAPANACINGTPVALSGSPTGGTFSGTGVTGTSFNPVTAGLGAKTITYTYTNSFGCISSTTHTITVVSPATGSIAGLAASYCIPGNQVVTLVGSPTGGTFSGPGMSNNLFRPQIAGTGAKTITYSFVDANGCANTTTANTTVNTTVATITGLASSYCLNSAPVTMVGNTAGGASGVFTGNGVVGNVFNPSFAGVGGHTITYTLTNPTTGCTGVVTKYVVVHSIPNVAIVNLASSQCVNGPAVTVSTSPSTGGTLSGPGISGTTFNPATAGVGTHTITYSWTNANNCTSTATQQVTVNGLPSVSFSGLAGPYCEKDPAVTLNGNPVGGYFTGPGVGSGTFYPLTATPGTHTVTYHYKHPVTGCTNTATQQAVVYANPVISLPNDTTICVNHIITLDAGAGGTSYQWSTGATTQTATINAATLGTGYHQIFVTVTNANNCSSSKMIKVIISPCEGIDDPDGITTVEAYPNPTDGAFNLTFHNVEGTFDMTIQNELGQIIGSEKVKVEDNVFYRKSINLSAQPAGVYFIRLANDQSTKVIRVVIQR